MFQNEFLEQIKLFNKKESLKIDDMQHLKALVSNNMENIAQCVCSQPGYERQALTEFVERIKTESFGYGVLLDSFRSPCKNLSIKTAIGL